MSAKLFAVIENDKVSNIFENHEEAYDYLLHWQYDHPLNSYKIETIDGNMKWAIIEYDDFQEYESTMFDDKEEAWKLLKIMAINSQNSLVLTPTIIKNDNTVIKIGDILL